MIHLAALAWAPHGNLLASASRDQTVRVFDIRSVKEWVVLRGHKNEVLLYVLSFSSCPQDLTHHDTFKQP